MPVLLPNVMLNTARSAYTSGTGTSAPTLYQQSIPAHIGPVGAQAYATLPAAALEANVQAMVEKGTDIRSGDRITSITLPDGLTPWGGHGDRDSYIIKYIQESAPGPLAHRAVFIQHLIGGGPAYAGT